jgi:DNA helicase II / ATP-dependent DNA helicase PcrA
MQVLSDGLNAEQRRAATHGDGPLLILAGAGTGKTRTLAHRVGHLIDQGVSPDRLLLLTFSRRAAREMVSRVGQMVGEARARQVWGGTFHAMGNRLLRIYGHALGLPSQFTVLDQADAADLMDLIRSDLGLDRSGRRFPRKDTLADIYSRMVNARLKLGEVLETSYPWCADEVDGIRAVFEAYTRRKRLQGVLDYDDLLLYWQALMQVRKTGDLIAGLFRHILVDEFQDTNAAQLEILRELRRANPNIAAVGDDAQSIYSFRAATVRNILDFPAHFPGTEIVRLEQNYRSTPPILALANAVLAGATEGYQKRLWSDRSGETRAVFVTCLDEGQEAEAVCERVLERREEGVPLTEQAVLFRTSHHSDALEVELARRNIPFVKYGGLKFLEAAHVKDLLALLRILENPLDEMSWFRVLMLLDGIGPATARKLIAALGVRRDSESGGDIVQSGLDRVRSPLRLLEIDGLPVPASAAVEFGELRNALRATDALPPAQQIERLRRFYDAVVDRVYENGEARKRDLQQLEQVAGRYASRAEFIADLTLDPPASTSELAGSPLLDEDYLILSTIHSAKGCEWTDVHVLHAADGMIPSDMATGSREQIEEERRLFYVALTRAKDRLSVYFPMRLYHRRTGRGDRHSFAQPTRFLTEEALATMDREVRYDEIKAAAPRKELPQSVQSVDSLLHDLLRE